MAATLVLSRSGLRHRFQQRGEIKRLPFSLKSTDAIRRLGSNPLGLEAGDTNLFRYVVNHPLLSADASGLEEKKEAVAQVKISDALPAPGVLLGKIGAFFWPVKFDLTKKAGPKGGAIIQKISITWDITVHKDNGQKETYKTGDKPAKKLPGMTFRGRQIATTYLEAWPVNPGDTKPSNRKQQTFDEKIPFVKMMKNYGIVFPAMAEFDDVFAVGPAMMSQAQAVKTPFEKRINSPDLTGYSEGSITFKGEVRYYENADQQCLNELGFMPDNLLETGAGGLQAVWDHGKITIAAAEAELEKRVKAGTLVRSDPVPHEISIKWDAREVKGQKPPYKGFADSKIVEGSKKP